MKRALATIRYVLILFMAVLATSTYAQKVYTTPSGKKYHRGTCRMVNNVSTEWTIEEAVKNGYTACRICNPPVPGAAPLSITNTPQGTDKSVQCRGITKAGTRCKHFTKLANGYCFQHNPDKKGVPKGG